MKDVVKTFPSVQCLLIGEGKMEESLRASVRDLRLDNNVRFLPIVRRTQEMLSVLDICIVPSRQEGLGLSVMEAQASGIPVIASRVGGLKSLIIDGETGYFVEPEDPQGLADKIISVLENIDAAKKVGLKAREFILKDWSSEKTVAKIEQLYGTLIK
jgi:glycosyltransferase involved in cell wall biosynthesis